MDTNDGLKHLDNIQKIFSFALGASLIGMTSYLLYQYLRRPTKTKEENYYELMSPRYKPVKPIGIKDFIKQNPPPFPIKDI